MYGWQIYQLYSNQNIEFCGERCYYLPLFQWREGWQIKLMIKLLSVLLMSLLCKSDNGFHLLYKTRLQYPHCWENIWCNYCLMDSVFIKQSYLCKLSKGKWNEHIIILKAINQTTHDDNVTVLDCFWEHCEFDPSFLSVMKTVSFLTRLPAENGLRVERERTKRRKKNDTVWLASVHFPLHLSERPAKMAILCF